MMSSFFRACTCWDGHIKTSVELEIPYKAQVIMLSGVIVHFLTDTSTYLEVGEII